MTSALLLRCYIHIRGCWVGIALLSLPGFISGCCCQPQRQPHTDSSNWTVEACGLSIEPIQGQVTRDALVVRFIVTNRSSDVRSVSFQPKRSVSAIVPGWMTAPIADSVWINKQLVEEVEEECSYSLGHNDSLEVRVYFGDMEDRAPYQSSWVIGLDIEVDSEECYLEVLFPFSLLEISTDRLPISAPDQE